LGICYYVRAEHNPFTDHGFLSISAGVDNSRVEEAIRGIIGECDRFRKEIVSEEELQKAKDYIAGTTMLELETSDARAEFCGYQEIIKKTIDMPADIIAKINSVTSNQVQELAKEVFINSGLNIAMIGRFKDDQKFRSYFKFD
jgi:predicted Zn-dependent peptidase